MLTRTPVSTVQDFAADVRGVDALRQTAKTSPKAAAHAVAQQFESLLMQQLVKSMRDASPHYDELQSSSTDLYRGLYDQQMALTLAKRGGVGLAGSIERQIEIMQNPALLKTMQRHQSRQQGELAPVTGGSAAANSAALMTARGGVTGKDLASAASGSGFVDKVLTAAQSVAPTLGVSPQLLLAHAALETGWGKKPIRDAAGGDSHNLFGIKATKDWQGKTVDVTTTEYVDGVAQKRVESFRSYDSYTEALADYAGLIRRRFGEAIGKGDDALGFARALQAKGYATDPQYADKFASVARRIGKQLAGAASS
ncbi:flagellar assembly peptidoglycan hydrolase FlgJ [Jeongeupia naejangsanensis]|uniref:Peptidoglycan hydrolase FlgJ n=1 Tax=Jeongeupia naejangsanensis TaxID=613195 RepID=A0ABS2BI45_9NEIS|nr:flagellar assembly peptidoglycan hydrolase FlgJ [Jeongeupia naejangsanensis]MBM3115269.1 flagellar assembly peptidoglycan hydrolase FlgJ [Jeongeupia naejangsanensis]